MQSRQIYLGAARALAGLAGSVPPGMWDAPALGVWDVRALLGHAARSLTLVTEYLGRRPDGIAWQSAAEYFATLLGGADEQLHAGVAERGVEAGAALGADPAATVRRYLADVEKTLSQVDDDAPVWTPAGGMPLADYLETRAFELTVHGLDLADAVGIPFDVPEGAIEQTVLTLARLGVLTGRGPEMIRLLTGRAGSAFSLL